MKLITLALKITFISCILLSCTESSNRTDQGPVFVVIVAPFSGPLSEFGWSMLRGGRMRIDEGRDRVRLIALDDRGKPEEAMRLATNVVNHQSIVAVIGHLTTACTLSAAPVYNAARLIHISPVVTGDDPEGIRSPYTFRTIHTERQQAMSLADYMFRTLVRGNAALIYEDSPLGNWLRDYFLSQSGEIGLSVKAILVEGDRFPSLAKAIGRVVKLRAEAVFSAGGPRLAGLIVRKWPEKLERPLIFGTYRLISREFTELAANHNKGILAAHPCVWRSDFEKGRNIRERYEREFKYAMDWPAIQTYDAVALLLWAINKSGADPDSMRRALRGLSSRDSSVPGLAGPIYFNRDGFLAREVTVASYTGSGWKLRED